MQSFTLQAYLNPETCNVLEQDLLSSVEDSELKQTFVIW